LIVGTGGPGRDWDSVFLHSPREADYPLFGGVGPQNPTKKYLCEIIVPDPTERNPRGGAPQAGSFSTVSTVTMTII
jgi:hypothetical protein